MNKVTIGTNRMFRVTLALLLAMSYAISGDGAQPAKAAAGVDISAAGNQTCIVTSEGGARCWGDNDFGQLGNGSNVGSNTPVKVNGLSSGVVAISAGESHTCALTRAGGVQCWGDNIFGKLGNGSNVGSNTPVKVNGLRRGVIAISGGRNHTCALTRAGVAKCWGNNDYGQLGNGSNVGSNIPVNVNGLSTGVIAISAGHIQTCVVTSEGGVQCWGDNDYGQLGNESNTGSNTPVDVNGLSWGVTVISAASWHACALTQNEGVALCWGNNYYGQLGNGTNSNSNTPVGVRGFEGVTGVELDLHLTHVGGAIIDAIAGGDVQTSVNGLNSCQVDIALMPPDPNRIGGKSLGFFIHTTQASKRVEVNPGDIHVWLGEERVNPDSNTIIPGVTRVLVEDREKQPLTVEVTIDGQTCSSMVVIQ